MTIILPSYIGCEVRVSEVMGEYIDGILMNVDIFNCIIQYKEANKPVYEFAEIEYVKPILTKLCNIVDEDVFELKTYFNGEFSGFVFAQSLFKEILPGSGWSISELSSAIQFLKSRGYDCDELIYHGLAIEKA